ncbi:class I SAM-dependent methyltransferase [Coralliovum pocilloporae]|uniref:class I SAM-dependent methyltransferase n=1 Tax=Coralliovum pocilloporae TaxID=3066369 RepID=UPI0033075783
MSFKTRILSEFSTDLRFLKQWADNPLTTGAIAASGVALSRAMAEEVPSDQSGPVLELGPGTGSVTSALLASGVARSDLSVIEYSVDFSQHLRKTFPGLTVYTGDAYALEEIFKEQPDLKFRAIVSSLPLLTRPLKDRTALVESALEHLRPGAPFIQFSYGPQAPVKARRGIYSASPSKWIIRNVPPARVWTYRSDPKMG